uniref:Uncharacterized protein n=1 Tax=Lotharella oceanica TaxID=641309 RepID=A0A7S2U0I9_9EUKA
MKQLLMVSVVGLLIWAFLHPSAATQTTSRSSLRLVANRSNRTHADSTFGAMGESPGELSFSRVLDQDGKPKFAYVWSEKDLASALEPLKLESNHLTLDLGGHGDILKRQEDRDAELQLASLEKQYEALSKF